MEEEVSDISDYENVEEDETDYISSVPRIVISDLLGNKKLYKTRRPPPRDFAELHDSDHFKNCPWYNGWFKRHKYTGVQSYQLNEFMRTKIGGALTGDIVNTLPRLSGGLFDIRGLYVVVDDCLKHISFIKSKFILFPPDYWYMFPVQWEPIKYITDQIKFSIGYHQTSKKYNTKLIEVLYDNDEVWTFYLDAYDYTEKKTRLGYCLRPLFHRDLEHEANENSVYVIPDYLGSM